MRGSVWISLYPKHKEEGFSFPLLTFFLSLFLTYCKSHSQYSYNNRKVKTWKRAQSVMLKLCSPGDPSSNLRTHIKMLSNPTSSKCPTQPDPALSFSLHSSYSTRSSLGSKYSSPALLGHACLN